MFYTLLKFLGWGLLLAFVGGCVGWALRALRCRSEIAQARATTVDVEEVERMRHRLANLDHVVAERDRLRMQVADMRHADSPGVVGAPPDEPADVAAVDAGPERVLGADGPPANDAIVPDADDSIVPGADDSIVPDADDSPIEGASEVAPLGALSDEPADARSDDAPSGVDTGGAGDDGSDAGPGGGVGDAPDGAPAPAATLDLAVAAEVLGKKVALDDLTVVEGIGPKIAELCQGIGITTWSGLADAEVDTLQSMLDAAGSRFSVHKPGSWPRQAGLLASGRWDEFKALTDELDGGR